jgi:hypothetical protein
VSEAGGPCTRMPADTGLLLLGAALESLELCMVAANSTHTGCEIVCKGLQQYFGSSNASEGQQQGGQPMTTEAGLLRDNNDLVQALRAVLSVSHALLSGGLWWQEAKAHCPLLLIERLHNLSRVRRCGPSRDVNLGACSQH